jgi:hypothetical protein
MRFDSRAGHTAHTTHAHSSFVVCDFGQNIVLAAFPFSPKLNIELQLKIADNVCQG